MASADVVIAFDARLGNLEAATKRISTSLNNVDRQAKEAQRSVSTMSSSVSSAFSSMAKAAVGFAAGLALVSTAVQAFTGAFKFADELADMAEQIGVSVEELQTLQLAVINAGGSGEKAGKALIKLGELIGDATRGGEEAAKTFMKLGVSYQTVDGAARSTSNVLEDLRGKLEAAGTHQERLSIAAEVFGAKNAPAMVVALMSMDKGLTAAAAKAAEMNRVLGKEGTDAVGAVDDAVNELGRTINVELAQIIAKVGPELVAFFKWIAEQVRAAGAIIRDFPIFGGKSELAQATDDAKAYTDALASLNAGLKLTRSQYDALKRTRDQTFFTPVTEGPDAIDLIKLNDLAEQAIATQNRLKAAAVAPVEAPEKPLAKPGSNLKPEKAKKVEKTDEEKEFERLALEMQNFAEALEKATRLPLEAFNKQLDDMAKSFNLTNDFAGAGGPETFLRGILKAGEEAAEALVKAGKTTTEATAIMTERMLALKDTFADQGLGSVDDWGQRVQASMQKVRDAADKSLAQDIKGVFTSWASSIEESFSGIVDGTVKTADAFDSMVKAVINSMAKLVARRFILKPLEDALEPILTNLAKLAGTAFGSSIDSITIDKNAMGGAFSGGHLLAYAQGGVVSRPTLFPMARGMGLMGEAGPEGILPLSRAASGRLGVDASGMGGAPVVVNVVNAAPNTTTRAEEKQGMNGKEISIFIEQQVQQGIAQGRFDKSLSANFGVNRRGRY